MRGKRERSNREMWSGKQMTQEKKGEENGDVGRRETKGQREVDPRWLKEMEMEGMKECGPKNGISGDKGSGGVTVRGLMAHGHGGSRVAAALRRGVLDAALGPRGQRVSRRRGVYRALPLYNPQIQDAERGKSRSTQKKCPIAKAACQNHHEPPTQSKEQVAMPLSPITMA